MCGQDDLERLRVRCQAVAAQHDRAVVVDERGAIADPAPRLFEGVAER
jgi:hypothetical protein